MVRQKCIFVKDQKQGMQVFWFEPCRWEEEDLVQVFYQESAKSPFIKLPRAQIIPLSDRVELEEKWGNLYPTKEWVKQLQAQWAGD